MPGLSRFNRLLLALDQLVLSPQAVRWIVLLGVILVLPGLFAGFFADDFSHAVLIQQPDIIKQSDKLSLFHLFSFVDTDLERRQQLLSASLIPWWTSGQFSLLFWRPVAELTHYIDYQWLRGHAWLMHAHSIGWYALLLMLLGRFYQRFCSSQQVAGLALLIFALDATHGFTVAWLANRNAILAAVFSVLAVLLHDDYRMFGRLRSYFASLPVIALSFLSAEIGICVGVFLLAYALFIDKDGAWKGLLALMPALAVFVAWFSIYQAFGYGAKGNEAYYLDPLFDIWPYSQSLFYKLPAYLDMQFNILPFYHLSGFETFSLIVGYLFAVLVIVFEVKRDHPSLRFFILILFLSIIPIASAEVQERNMLYVNIAGAVFLAEFLVVLRRYTHQLTAHWLQRIATLAMVCIVMFHIVFSGLCMLPASFAPKIFSIESRRVADRLGPDLEGRYIVTLGVSMFDAAFLMPIRKAQGESVPERYWNIATSTHRLSVERVADNAIELQRPDGFFSWSGYSGQAVCDTAAGARAIRLRWTAP